MTIGIALIILLIVLLIGCPIPLAFVASSRYLIFVNGYDPGFLLPYGFSKMNSMILLTIPLFVMAGAIMDKGGIGDRLVDLVEITAGKIKGGMGVVTIVTCAIFGSVTGSSSATVSCIGSIMMPKLAKNGYPTGLSAALLANSGVLGILIPPSTIMILYGWIGNVSVLACFLATVIPGIILVILFSLINIFLVRNNMDIKVQEKENFVDTAKKLGRKTWSATPALLMPVIILGSIYGGIMTPTEAAAVSVIYSVPVGFLIYKQLKVKSFIEILIESATTTGVIMVMLFAVMILSRVYVMENLPQKILVVLSSISESKMVLLFMLNVFMIIIGMLMDDVSAVLLCTPILLPVAVQLGVHPVHFAAILGVNLGMGNITPPTAPLLYLAGRIGKAKINDMLMPSAYLILFAWIPTLILTTFVPSLSLFLPRLILHLQ